MPAPQFAKLRWLRFSLATFLFVSLCIGAIIAGYQSGYRRGLTSGQAQRYDETQVSEIYNTTMFIGPDLSDSDRADALESLKQLIKTTGSPGTWSPDTNNDIREFPATQIIIVTAPGWVQHEIRNIVTKLQHLAMRGTTDEVLPSLERLASQGQTQFDVLPNKSPKNSKFAGAWLEKYYEASVTGVASQWGAPKFRGKCLDPGFPPWSLDQQIATWPRGNGLAYLALRCLDDGQVRIVAGWRENS